jgi:hypothetical protein
MSVPPDLRAAIERDLKRARPLARPSVRALVLVPVALAMVIGIPAVYAFRPDMAVLGFIRAWGFSIGQAVAGCTIVAVALRESIPGRALSRLALAAIIAGGIALPAVVLLLSTSSFTIGPADHAAWEGFVCFRTSALAALPALLFAGALAARALPLRPAAAGALYGLGAGLMSDAGLRLYCDYSVVTHLLFSHMGAVAGVTLAGAGLASVIQWIRKDL